MPFQFRSVEDIEQGLYKRAIVRVDFNVPVENGAVTEGFRIDQSFPTLDFLTKRGFSIVLLAHLGEDGASSLKPVADYLAKYGKYVLASSLEEADRYLMKGERTVLLENIRRFEGEKENSIAFCRQLSALGDIFVNEGFSVSHRKHASVVGLPEILPSFAGMVFRREVETLSKVFEPAHPFILILGGKKAETKLPLVEKFEKTADKIVMGGALANDFLKVSGKEIGRSVVSGKNLIKKEWLSDSRFIIPERVIVLDEKGSQREESVESLKRGDMIVDVAPSFLEKIGMEIKGAKTVVWNGSFGIFEKGQKNGTEGVAKAVIKSGAFSIVGGGDTTGALEEMGLSDKFSFVSTGGGAMLDFLAQGTLPGIKALEP
jgi:phosphoglycerate kinase